MKQTKFQKTCNEETERRSKNLDATVVVKAVFLQEDSNKTDWYSNTIPVTKAICHQLLAVVFADGRF